MNKTIILSSLVIAIALFGYISHTQNQVSETPAHIRLAYQKWALSYKRLYSSPQEQHFRLSVFEKTYNEVEKHNANKSATWTMELNQFSDMTMEEIKAKYLGDMSEIRDALDGELMHEADPFTQIPSSADNRKYVPQLVLNQGRCGSCWAFAAASAGEASYNKAKGKMVQFSPQQVLSCSGGGSCQGGIHPQGLNYYTKTGAATHVAYPYLGVESTCDSSKLKSLTETAKVQKTISGSYTTWQDAAAGRTVSMSMWVSAAFMQYKSGIFDDATVNACKNGSQGGHAVTIVGYTPEAWIVKNSWGPGWGEKGYFRIRMSKDSTGICEMYRRGSYVDW